MENIIIVGGGQAGGQATLTLIKEGVTDPITLITQEDYLPYERPGLSKGYLQGKEAKDGLFFDKSTFEDTKNLTIKLNTKISQIDSINQTVISKNGDVYPYTKLLLATGSTPIKLELLGQEKKEILYLRTIDDSDRIKEKIKDNCQTAIVIGASFIGMEVASSLSQLGLKVTILHRDDTVFGKLNSKELSAKFIKYYEEKGITFVLGDEAGEISESGIATQKGLAIEGDIIIAGIGVRPNLELAEEAGLEINHGVVVNEFLQTSQPNIWAAGDIAVYPDKFSGTNRRLEHWDAANEQGQYVAKQMLGLDEPYNHLSYFFSDIFDLSFEFFGDSSLSKRIVEIDNWNDKDKTYILLYLDSEDVLVASFIMNVTDEIREKIMTTVEKKKRISEDFIQSIS